MLALCQDWRSLPGGAVAADLVTQLERRKLRNAAAGYLLGASLDLLVATWPRKGRPPLRIETLSEITWRISSLYYMYLPENDDAAFGTCIRLARSSELTVVVPRCNEELKRRLLMAALRRRAPNTWSFKPFISWRTLSATVDQGWPRELAVLELLAAYNRRVHAAGRGEAMLVDIPQGLR